MRKEFKMSEEQQEKLLLACRATPVMFLSGGEPMGASRQENANRAWIELGKEMGFDGMTVGPCHGKNSFYFTAEVSPSEPEKVGL